MSQRRTARTGRLLVVALLCCSGLLSGTISGSADDVGNAQNQLNQDRSKQSNLGSAIAKLNGQIQYLTTRVAQLQAALDAVDRRIASQKAAIAQSQATLQRIADDLVKTTTLLAQTRARLQTDQSTLAASMVRLYEEGPTSTLNAVLSSGDFDQLWTRISAAKRVSDAQRDQITVVTGERRQIEQLVATITSDKEQQQRLIARQEADERQLEADRQAQADLQKQLADAKAQDEAQLAAQEQSKREVDSEVAADAQALSDAKRRKAEAEAAAAAAARGHGGSFTGGGNGHFLWPEQAPISQYFGCTSWPYENYDADCPYPHRFHTGIDLAGPWGAPLLAADTGIAYVYTSTIGYGNHVIIVHDNGWVTLYGHMSSFAVSSGQVVGRGQLIGYEGSTGNSSGPHCHFEVRLNGNPVNPLAYLS